MTLFALPITSIKVDDRHRKDLGDIAGLARSIEDVGLLHAVVITADHRLVAGRRRLEACRRLKFDEIPVRVVASLHEASDLLRAERDENTCRKDFTPSEAVSLGRALEELERPKAEERVTEGARRGGQASGKLPEASTPPVRDIVGPAVGMSGRTYAKAREVVATAEDETQPEPIRMAAVAAVAEMDATGKVDGAFRRVQQAKAESSPLAELVDKVSRSDVGYRAALSREIVKTRDLLHLDPERAAAVALTEDRSSHLAFCSDVRTWLDQFERGLRSSNLRSVQ